MSIQNVGLKAYGNAMANFAKAQKTTTGASLEKSERPRADFTDTVKDSIAKVNDMQQEKSLAIQSFASGETQNVHELMVTLQKAGLAMKMTSAVRGKIMEAYKTMSTMQI